MAHGWQDFSIQTELKQLLRTPAPRQLSASLRKHLSKSAGHWSLVIFGLLFGAFGSVFCVFFVPWQFVNELILDKAPPQLVIGRVTHAEKSNMSINKVSVWKYETTFVGDEPEMSSFGYTTGRRYSEGDEVFVRVHPQNPDLHCPQGMRMSKTSLAGSFVLIFPLVGFTLMVSPWFAKRRRISLYENGSVAEVQVLAMDATSMLVNDQRVYRFTLKFSNLPETVEVKKSNINEVSALEQAYEAKETIHILYNPKKPKRFIKVPAEIA